MVELMDGDSALSELVAVTNLSQGSALWWMAPLGLAEIAAAPVLMLIFAASPGPQNSSHTNRVGLPPRVSEPYAAAAALDDDAAAHAADAVAHAADAAAAARAAAATAVATATAPATMAVAVPLTATATAAAAGIASPSAALAAHVAMDVFWMTLVQANAATDSTASNCHEDSEADANCVPNSAVCSAESLPSLAPAAVAAPAAVSQAAAVCEAARTTVAMA